MSIIPIQATPARQYKGMRYVPIFDGDWDSTKDYDPLVIVSYQGNSYTSRTFVPAGTDISNETYWALTGNYNAQVEAYRQEVATLSDTVDKLNYYATPQMYGAIGDGVHDDTSAIQSVIDENDNIIIPPGNYKITSPIEISEKTISFICYGVIENYAAAPAFIFTKSDYSTIYIYKIDNKNKLNDFKTTDYNYRVGVVIEDCFKSKFDVHIIKEFTTAIILCSSESKGCYYNKLKVGYSDGCLDGINIISYNANSYVNGNLIDGFNYAYHSWDNVTQTPYVIRFVSETYDNNSNLFDHIIYENGLHDLTYHPGLVHLEHCKGINITYDRIEDSSTPFDAFDFDITAQQNIVKVNMSWNTLNETGSGAVRGRNLVVYSFYPSKNGANCTDLLNSITLHSNVVKYSSNFDTAYINNITGDVVIEMELSTTANIDANSDIITGIPYPAKYHYVAIKGNEGNTQGVPDANYLFYVDRSSAKIKNITPLTYMSKIHLEIRYNIFY